MEFVGRAEPPSPHSASKSPCTPNSVRDVCESFDMQMLSSVWNEIQYHFGVFRITSGAHIEIRSVTVKL